MNRSRLAALAAVLALPAACGGDSTGSSSFQDAAPSYSALSMDLTSADQAAPTLAVAGTGTAMSALTADALTIPADCHPHLFQRTGDVVHRVNRHLWRALRHVERVIARSPTLATGAEQVWERVENGIDVKFTMTRTSDVAFTWRLELKKAADAQFATVVTGAIDRSAAQGPHQGTGELRIDLGALAGVTGEPVAGVLSATFESLAASRKLVVDAVNVVWDADANAGLARTPRSSHYVFTREPGKGGSLKVQEQMVFLCPANPGLSAADVKLVSRWFRTSSGSVHGRSDALMTGGQLAATNQVVGVTCHQSAAEEQDQAEGSWLMKVEDTSTTPPGNTVSGGARESGTAGASACDPVLGAIPNLVDASQDFGFGAVDFTTADPYPFPGA
jgi:hypothetical protein